MHLAEFELELYKNYTEYRAYKWVNWAVSPAIFGVGSVGNVLLMWLLLPNCSVTPTYQYLVLLGGVDQLVLTSGLMVKWLQHFFDFNVETQSRFNCLGNKFVSYFSSCLSALLISVVSLERAVVVCCPLKAAKLQSRRRIRLVMVAVIGSSVLVNSGWFFVLDHYLYPMASGANGSQFLDVCDVKPSALHLRGAISVVDAVLYSVLPLLIIFTCNIVIIMRLRHVRNERQTTLARHREERLQLSTLHADGVKPSSVSDGSSRPDSFRQVTVLLLSISTFYLAASLPVTLLKILTSLSKVIDLSAVSQDYLLYSRYRLLETVTYHCMCCNHAVNFFLYCASGQRIRQELRTRLAAACRCRRLMRTRGLWSRRTEAPRLVDTLCGTPAHGHCA